MFLPELGKQIQGERHFRISVGWNNRESTVILNSPKTISIVLGGNLFNYFSRYVLKVPTLLSVVACAFEKGNAILILS